MAFALVNVMGALSANNTIGFADDITVVGELRATNGSVFIFELTGSSKIMILAFNT